MGVSRLVKKVGKEEWEIAGCYHILAEELYVVDCNHIKDKYFQQLLNAFRTVCPDHTSECFVVLAKTVLGPWEAYLVFPHFENAERLHGIMMLVHELGEWCEFGCASVEYLDASREKLVIRFNPNADFVAMVFQSPWRRFR